MPPEALSIAKKQLAKKKPPQKPASLDDPPPPQTTWGKAAFVLVLALVFDAIRFVCEQFWIFGPIILGAGVTAAFGGGILGYAAGALAGGATGFFLPEVYAGLGVILAMAFGLLGWISVIFILFTTNRRIFKEQKDVFIWISASFIIDEIPIIGSLPSLSGLVLKLYSKQIKQDKANMKAYNDRRAELLRQQQAERLAYFAQYQAALAEGATEEEAAQEAEESADREREDAQEEMKAEDKAEAAREQSRAQKEQIVSAVKALSSGV